MRARTEPGGGPAPKLPATAREGVHCDEPQRSAGAGTGDVADPPPGARAPTHTRWLNSFTVGNRDTPVLILVGWAPARLAPEPPAVLGTVRSHLRAMQDYVGVTRMEVGIWQPDARFLERLAWRLRFDPRAVSGAAVLAEVEGSIRDPMFDSPPPRPAPATYWEAEDQLRQALHSNTGGPHRAEDVRRARDHLHRRLERDVLRPLLQRSGSPSKRNL
jgi:hypothetical protein